MQKGEAVRAGIVRSGPPRRGRRGVGGALTNPTAAIIEHMFVTLGTTRAFF